MKECLSFTVLFLLIIHGVDAQSVKRYELIDQKATRETQRLFINLKRVSEKHILFGHQHATEYGHGWSGDANRSDVKSVTGSHPAVIGVDLMNFAGASTEAAQKAKQELKRNVEDTYHRGGVTMVAWHFSNPVSSGGFYWRDSVSLPAVKFIIPGGEAHQKYKSILKEVGEWANNLTGKDGKRVPVIFRPYHEFDGGWFWWGKPHCTRDEFISLWRFTVSYLRDSLNVHNFIYAFSPDNKFICEEQFLERYPGDAWVDMVGMDNYGDMGRNRYALDTAALKLKVIADYAKRSGKLAAFTETGLESIPNTTWWTETLLRVLKWYDIQLSYVLVWRNDIKSPTHYYAPYPGQASVSDFMRFYNDPFTLFENNVKGMYKKKVKFK